MHSIEMLYHLHKEQHERRQTICLNVRKQNCQKHDAKYETQKSCSFERNV